MEPKLTANILSSDVGPPPAVALLFGSVFLSNLITRWVQVPKASHVVQLSIVLFINTNTKSRGSDKHGSYREELSPASGTLGVVLGDSTLTFKPGETAVIPIGTQHRFFNPSEEETVEFVGKVVPAHEGFEKSVHLIYGLAADGQCDAQGLPKSFVHLCLMGDLGDMRWPGMLAMANPLIKAVAAYARWSGEEERLLKKYWY
jgi:hypothetical protein